MTNLDIVLKRRDITLPTKVHIVKAMVFPVAMYGCESWTIKKADCQRIDAFELWCWGRLLRVPWTARRSNPSIPKEINPEYALEGQMVKLKPLLWPPDVKSWLIGKEPDAEKDWGQMKRAARMRWLDSITDSTDMNLSKLQQIVEDRGAWHATVHGVVNSQTWQWLKNNQRGFPHGSNSKESTYNARDIGGVGSIPGSGKSLGGGNGNPLEYSLLENPMDRRAWRATVHRVEKNWTWLSMHVLLSPHKKDPRELSLCVQTQ